MKQRTGFFLAALIATLFSVNAFAQAFEGTISMQVISASADKPMPMSVSSKGDKSLIVMESQKGTMEMFMDRSTSKMNMVMLDRKMGFTMDIKKTDAKDVSTDKATVVATGQKKTISGYSCELFTISTEGGQEKDWWMTRDLPQSLMSGLRDALSNSSNNPMARGNKPGGLGQAIEDLVKKGYIPVQMESKKDGKTTSTVTILKYEPKKLDDSIFVVPSEIKMMQMPSMGGMGGGRE